MAERARDVAGCPPCCADSLLLALVSGGGARDDEHAHTRRLPRPTEDTFKIFSVRRPRDAIAGTASGLKTVVRSVASGAAAFLCDPIEGAKVDGVTGAFVGLGQGAISAMLIPTAGALVGVSQCVRGVANTPQALVEALRGRQWSDEERQWVVPAYSLPEEVRDLDRRRAAHNSVDHDDSDEDTDVGAGRPVRTVRRHSRSYYELLRVQPSATGNDLRRAYYRESRRCHPDKVGANPHAVARFQQLSEAYKVLRNPELRRTYDVGGHDAVVRMSTSVDLGMLYAVVLSGTMWEPFVGRLGLTRILASDTDQQSSLLESLASLWYASDVAPDDCQVEREVHCAVLLAERLRPAVDGDFEAFKHTTTEVAQTLVKAPFAPGVLRIIASVYEDEAVRFLGAQNLLDFRRELADIGSQGRLLAHQARAAVTGVRAVVALHSLVDGEDGGGARPDGTAQQSSGTTTLCLERPAVQAQLPTFAAALWQLTVLDIEGTLRRVCRRVLRDASQDLSVRARRAEALRSTAAAFRAAAEAPGSPNGIGAPGEDAPFLRTRVRDAAAKLVAGCSYSDDSGDGG